jgi:hypothetical protein
MHLRPGIPFLFFSGAGSNIRCYIAGVNVEYRGITFSIPTSYSSFSTSFLIYLQAVSISSSPVRNKRISPGSSKQ